ncbi:hypothetical protein BD626DRAFT_360849, partial [Schizophyllum amplum]
IVIRAGDYGFRVPQLQLSQRALLFADLFSGVPRSRTADTYHGYPLITLNDPPVDVEVFLLALFDAKFAYNLPSLPLSDPRSYRIYAGILKMSHRYRALYWRRKALYCLSPMYPTTLSRYDELNHPAHYNAYNARTARLASRVVVDAALAVGARWLVPAARLVLISASASNVSGGSQLRPHADEVKMWHEYKLWWIDLVWRMYCPVPAMARCASSDICRVALLDHREEAFDRRTFELRAILTKVPPVHRVLCDTCAPSYLRRHQLLRRHFWDSL